ncbi:MAG: RNA polymerase sigma factor [Bacteroidales bacterium]
MDEQQLIDGVKNRNRSSQRILYESFAPSMLSVCYRYVNDMEIAKDILQEGFIKIFNSIDTYMGKGSFEGWVRRIFINICLEHLRKNDILRNSALIDDPTLDLQPDYSAVDQIAASELMEIISELPPGFRTVFNMFAIEGYSHKEIADTLGITESTSRSQFTRAKQQLQKRLKDLYDIK